MIKVLKYTGDKTYMYPSGRIASPEVVKADYPAVEVYPYIIETDENEQVIFSISNLSVVRAQLEIDPELSEDEAIAKIQELRNAPPVIEEPEPDAAERIAAALEYQNLLSL